MMPFILPTPSKVGIVSLRCPQTLLDSERILSALRVGRDHFIAASSQISAAKLGRSLDVVIGSVGGDDADDLFMVAA